MANGASYIWEEPRRTELLKAYGLNDLTISLGNPGDHPDEIFDYYCVPPGTSTKDPLDVGEADVVGVYESQYDDIYGVRRAGEGLEFLSFHALHPAKVTLLGTHEQCLLGGLFEEMVDSSMHPRDDLIRAADSVGFGFLDETLEYVFTERERVLKGTRRDMKGYLVRRVEFIQSLCQLVSEK